MTDPTRPRSGAHRPRRRLAVVRVPLALALVAVVALVVAASGVVGGGGPGAGGTVAAGSGSATSRAVSSSAPATSSSSPAGGTPTSSTATATGSGSPTETPQRGTPVVVLNATRTAGLAARAATSLRRAGWGAVRTDNYRAAQPPTTVYYGLVSQAATAAALATDLGGTPRTLQSGQFGTDRVTVVLGTDYRGG